MRRNSFKTACSPYGSHAASVAIVRIEGIAIVNQQGNIVTHPAVMISKSCGETVRKLSAEFGLRSRIQVEIEKRGKNQLRILHSVGLKSLPSLANLVNDCLEWHIWKGGARV